MDRKLFDQVWEETYEDRHAVKLTNFTHEFFYAKGNIVRSYYHPYNVGFWLVVRDNSPIGKYLLRVTIDGQPMNDNNGQSVIRHIPDDNEGWLAKNVNEGRHPAFDRYNAAHRRLYDLNTDEMQAVKQVEEKKRQAAHDAWYAGLSDFEKRVYGFDWTWQEADQFYPGMHEKCEAIFEQLESMPYAEGKRIWDTCGPYRYGYKGAGHPDWTKCVDFAYPQEYILDETYPDPILSRRLTHFPSGTVCEFRRGENYGRKAKLQDFFEALDEIDVQPEISLYTRGHDWTTLGEWKASNNH